MEAVLLATAAAIVAAAVGFFVGRRRRAEEADLAEQMAILRAAKERAELDARSKGAFLARMSHELRTPLTTIIGFADVVQSELFGPLSPRYREYVQGILHSSRSLTRLLADVLDLCEIESGGLALHDEPVEPRDIVAGCLQLFGQRAMQRGCTLTANVEPGLSNLRADPRRLKQMLLILLDNALERSGEGGKVVVAAGRFGAAGMAFRVVDHGVGVRVSEANELGMTLARALAELHGGRLAMADAAEGGLTAEIWLPEERILPASAAPQPAHW